ncbi:MAG TPA: MBL fold metallo-hydrolase [Kiritimatiellia bacterium]|nr:MBL fold metallo-hydrolase [Kiritimatiellia bacterium]HMP32838.1 MBL fold metallo-hydrolase [Kiritimatiellia bacterium]
MKLVFGGVRGSCPVAQPDCMQYGGETTSILIEGAQGERILVDGGTGVRTLGKRLLQTSGSTKAWMFITHYHLDHVSGLPMLPILYRPDWRLTIAAPDHHPIHFREIMARIFDVPLWPLQVEDLKATIEYELLDGITAATPYACGGIEVSWCPLHHPGGCTAYRFDEPATGASVVIATDIEWALSTPGERGYLEQLLTFPSPAQLLVMDGQYEDREIASFRGWGHSSWQEAMSVASRGRVKQLLLTHHDPASHDRLLDERRRSIRAQAAWIDLARQGMELDLPGDVSVQQ